MSEQHLKQLWTLSMNGHTPIWLGGHLQRIVMAELGVEGHDEASKLLDGEAPRALTVEEGRAILLREERIRADSSRWPD